MFLLVAVTALFCGTNAEFFNTAKKQYEQGYDWNYVGKQTWQRVEGTMISRKYVKVCFLQKCLKSGFDPFSFKASGLMQDSPRLGRVLPGLIKKYSTNVIHALFI